MACYYLSNRQTFITNTTKSEKIKSRKSQSRENENILIYDMGAGTLDLTLLSLKVENDQATIDYKAKLGVNKAGNYLDYLIAEILKEFYENKNAKILKEYYDNKDQITPNPSKSTSTSNQVVINNFILLQNALTYDKETDSNIRTALKDFVQNSVKKSLNEKNLENNVPGCKLSTAEIDFGATFKEIIEHTSFETFINEITAGVLKNIVSEPNEIDTVIFSGRSTELEYIRKGVAGYFESNKKILYADICDLQYHDDVNYSVEEKNKKNLKAVVSLGALNYANIIADNRRYTFNPRSHYAAYYIVTVGELLGRSIVECYTLLTKDQELENGKMSAKCQIKEPRDLKYIGLVQTYLSDEDSIKACFSDYCSTGMFKSDMISQLTSIPTEMFRNLNEMNIEFTYDENNEIELCIDNQILDFRSREDFNDDNLRKSIWPVVWNVNR